MVRVSVTHYAPAPVIYPDGTIGSPGGDQTRGRVLRHGTSVTFPPVLAWDGRVKRTESQTDALIVPDAHLAPAEPRPAAGRLSPITASYVNKEARSNPGVPAPAAGRRTCHLSPPWSPANFDVLRHLPLDTPLPSPVWFRPSGRPISGGIPRITAVLEAGRAPRSRRRPPPADQQLAAPGTADCRSGHRRGLALLAVGSPSTQK